MNLFGLKFRISKKLSVLIAFGIVTLVDAEFAKQIAQEIIWYLVAQGATDVGLAVAGNKKA